jgi:hypothetical protein
MKNQLRPFALALFLACSAPVMARDSVAASTASVAVVSIAPASLAVVSAHVGSEMVVESIKVIGNVVEIVFKGAANASRVVLNVTADSAKATSIGVGQSIKVVAEGTGYLLIAAGKVLCFVPGEAEQALVRSSRSK